MAKQTGYKIMGEFIAGVIVSADKARAQKIVDEVFVTPGPAAVVDEFIFKPTKGDGVSKPLYAIFYEGLRLRAEGQSGDKVRAILYGAPWRWEWANLDAYHAGDGPGLLESEDWDAFIGTAYGDIPGLVIEVEVNAKLAMKEW